MSKKYEAPIEVRTLEKLITDFSYRNGLNARNVLDDLLLYIIHGFSPLAPPLKSWNYKKEQTMVFWDMLREWILIMDKQLKIHKWYDPFGDLYMALTSRYHQQNTGQFFTPVSICDLMVMITGKENSTGQQISDPACGSGRFLLAYHVNYPGNYLVAEDKAYTCCLMSAVNFLIHGCVGEVIWHNSLIPDSFSGGWKINETLNLTGVPTIRQITREEYLRTRTDENNK